MTLREVVKKYFYELDDGIPWILIYKDGRSWFGISLYTDDVDYDLSDGFTFSEYAMKLLYQAYEIDNNAILINGYYMNIGWSETERNTIQRFVDGIKYQYELFSHQLESIFNLENNIRDSEITEKEVEYIKNDISAIEEVFEMLLNK